MITMMRKAPVFLAVIAVASSYHVGSGASDQPASPEYVFVNLRSLDVTNTRGNSINNTGWVAGYSSLAGSVARNAVAWFHGQRINLGTLGGTNSSVAWPVKNDSGLIVGIAQTNVEHPSAATWSCAFFFPGPDSSRYTCRGFAWEADVMRALPTLGGGINGYAAGANNRREIVGWAENGVVDTESCAAPRTIQFRPVIWGPGTAEIRELPLWSETDTSGAATAINDVGQVVGISGTCDQAIGRHTARHAVIWENGTVDNIGTLGGNTWNTPTAINRHGVVVGFASQAGDDPNNPRLRAFVWTRSEGIRDLGTLYPDHTTALALGINDKGQIVGTSCPVQGACHAFLYENGVMRDLNAFRVPGYEFHLTRAQDINNDGAITGSAVDLPVTTPSQTRAFLALPTGPPTASGGAAAGAPRPRSIEGVLEDPAHPMAPRRNARR
jgi:probable HAF family extracellular repeat protein